MQPGKTLNDDSADQNVELGPIKSHAQFRFRWPTTLQLQNSFFPDFLLFFLDWFECWGVQNHPSWVAVQPGFLPYQVGSIHLGSHFPEWMQSSAWMDTKPGWTTMPEDWIPLYYIILQGFQWTLEHPWVKIQVESFLPPCLHRCTHTLMQMSLD